MISCHTLILYTVLFIYISLAQSTFGDSLPPKSVKVTESLQETIDHWGDENLIAQPQLSVASDSVLPHAVVEINTATSWIGKVRPIEGTGGIEVSNAKDPKEAAEQFLRTHHLLFGLSNDLSEVRLVREKPSLVSVGLTYQQFYKGLPVLSSEIYVLAHGNRIDLISSSLAKIAANSHGVELNMSNADSESAIRAVAQDIQGRVSAAAQSRSTPKAELGIVVTNGVPKEVWDVMYPTAGGSYRAIVDAKTNVVLWAYSTSIEN